MISHPKIRRKIVKKLTTKVMKNCQKVVMIVATLPSLVKTTIPILRAKKVKPLEINEPLISIETFDQISKPYL